MIDRIKNKKQLAGFVVAIVFVALITFYIVNNWQEFSALEIVSPKFLVFIAVGTIINLYATGAMMDTLLRLFGLNISRKESFGLASLTRFCNQISPGKIGFLVRASYLKNKYDFTITSSVSTIAASHTILYFISSLLGLLSMLVLRFAGYEVSFMFGALLAFLLLITVFVILLPRIRIPFIHKWPWASSRQENFNEGWSKINQSPRSLIRISGWAILSILSTGLIFYGSFGALGANIGILGSVFVTSITLLNSVIGFTPAGIGISEGLTVIAGTALGLPVAVSLAAAMLKRLFIFVMSTLLAIYFSKNLLGLSVISLLRKGSK